MTVRNMKPADISSVYRIEQEIFSDPWSILSIGDTCRQKQTIALVVEIESEVIGYVLGYMVVDEVEIIRIAVAKKNQRQGAGSFLLRRLQEECRQHNIRKILLDVRENNVKAICFYKKFGFIKDGRRRCFYENPREDAILMSWQIG